MNRLEELAIVACGAVAAALIVLIMALSVTTDHRRPVRPVPTARTTLIPPFESTPRPSASR